MFGDCPAVRVGGRCESPLLQGHTLASLQQHLAEGGRRQQQLYQQHRAATAELRSLASHLNTVTPGERLAGADCEEVARLSSQLERVWRHEAASLCLYSNKNVI